MKQVMTLTLKYVRVLPLSTYVPVDAVCSSIFSEDQFNVEQHVFYRA